MRGKKLTNDVADKRLKGTNIKRIGDVVGSNKPLLCQCEMCGHKWKPKATSVLNDKDGCPECARANRYLSVEDVDKRLLKRSIKRINKYNGVLNIINCKCMVCNHKWFVTAAVVIGGGGCPNCAAIKNRQPRQTTADIDKRLRGTKIKRIGNYTRMRDPMLCRCRICKHEWSPTPTMLINQGKGCPICSSLKNEKMVVSILKKNKISFVHHQKLHEMIDIKRLITVDFYLPKFKIIIEYNGHQHYEPVRWPGMNQKKANSAFIKQQKRDKLVKRICKKMDVTLISIDGRIYRNNKLKSFLIDLIKDLRKEK